METNMWTLEKNSMQIIKIYLLNLEIHMEFPKEYTVARL